MKTIPDFLAELVDDPARVSEYMADPTRALASAGLSQRDQETLRSGDLVRVREAISAAPGWSQKPQPRNMVVEPEPGEPEPGEPPPPRS